MDNAIALLPNFVSRKLHVVIDYPLDIYWHGRLSSAGTALNTDIFTFTLKPKLEVVLMKRGPRDVPVALAKRIRELYSTDINDPSLGVFIDNSDQTPEETAGVIIGYISRQRLLA